MRSKCSNYETWAWAIQNGTHRRATVKGLETNQGQRTLKSCTEHFFCLLNIVLQAAPVWQSLKLTPSSGSGWC